MNFFLKTELPEQQAVETIFVAVGAVGVIGNEITNVLTSPDGITWTPRSSGPDLLSAVAYGNGTFVSLVGAYTGTFPPPTMLTSVDGITWTARFLGFYGTGVSYGNNTFVVVGNSGLIIQSDPLSGNCTAMLSPDLNLNVPIIRFNGSFIGGDAMCQPAPDGSIRCRVINYGEVNPQDFVGCQPSTLSPDLKLYVPAGIYNNLSYEAYFEYMPTADGQIWFKLVSATRN